MAKTITINICEETYDFIEDLIRLGTDPEQHENVLTIDYSLIVERGSPDTYFGHFGDFCEVVYYDNIRNIFKTSLLYTLMELSKKGLVLMPIDLEIPNGFKVGNIVEDMRDYCDDADEAEYTWLDEIQDTLLNVCCASCKAKLERVLLEREFIIVTPS